MDERRALVGSEAPPTSGTPSEVPSARLVFRFMVGGTWLAADWLGSALKALDQAPTSGEWQGEVAPMTARNVVIGALSAALRGERRSSRLRMASEKVGRATKRSLRLLSHVPGAGTFERRYRKLRQGVVAQMGRWAEEGAREDLAGRRLARLATPSFFELAVARAAESPELQTVIEEQSEGLAASSVAELRERSELADQKVEGLARRLLRQSPEGGGAAKGPVR